MEKKPQLVAKENKVAELKEAISAAQGVLLVDYRGLTVKEVTELRAKLRAEEVHYEVAKNTLIKRAANALEISALDNFLEGPTAIAFADDALGMIKVITEFAKEHKALEVKAGLMDNEFIDVNTIDALSKVPSREVLLTQLAVCLQAPMRNLAVVVNQIKEKKEKEEVA